MNIIKFNISTEHNDTIVFNVSLMFVRQSRSSLNNDFFHFLILFAETQSEFYININVRHNIFSEYYA